MYKQYFGFVESPFSITPDPNFFYNNSVYAEALANLRYGIEAKRGFIAVTGEVGTGKTTLLRKLMRELRNSIHFAFIYNTELTFNELLRVILTDLGLSPDGKDRLAMIDELNAYLLEQLEQGGIVCLLIDEVQNLSDESLEGLRLLSNLETDREKLLQIVLMGQPELNARLDQPNLRQVKQRIAIQCEPAPISGKEVAAYINFRLQTAGCERQDIFSKEAVRKIAFYSKGIPRLINVMCDNALVIAYAASQKFISGDVIEEVAHDLRLGPETQHTQSREPLNGATADGKAIKLAGQASDGGHQHYKTLLSSVGVPALLVVSGFLAAVSLIGTGSVFSTLRRSIDFFKSDVHEPLLLRNPPLGKTLPDRGIAEVKIREQASRESEMNVTNDRLIIQYGSTIYEIAADHYGSNVATGMDLIKEVNPDIRDLNWVAAGQELLLPRLRPENLLRQHADGSYSLIISSFLSRSEADTSARRISREGYRFTITPRRVSNDLVLHRLEIEGLKSVGEATQAWETGIRNKWLTTSEFLANVNSRSQRSIDRRSRR